MFALFKKGLIYSYRPFLHLLFVLLIAFVFSFVKVFTPPPLYQAQVYLFSLSKGNQYYGHLLLWQYYVQTKQWPKAYYQESLLDPVDTAYFKSLNYPEEIGKKIGYLEAKNPKTAQDWYHLALYQLQLDQKTAALDSLKAAKKLDPINSDIDKLLIELSSK